MSDFDLLVRSEQDIGISEGKIVSLGKNLAGSATAEIDAHGLTIFPGVIDSHVHFNEPGRADWEGFATGSRAAAAGGTTTIFDMPLNAHPPTIDAAAFDAKRAAAEKNSLVDFGLWGGLVPGNLEQLEALRDRGVVGIKAFMCDSGIDDFPAVDLATLRAGMKRAAELDLLVAVHAESNELLKVRLRSGTVRDYLDSRPIQVELAAIKTAIELAHEVGCRLHIVHISCGRGVALVNYARAHGADVTCETCPHYLFLTDEDMMRLGAVAKCAPPLRSPNEQTELWQRLPEIATIGSDHSPSPWSMKEREDFFQVWGGVSGCQHLLPLLMDAPERISRAEIERLTSAGVAKRFRISEKGGLQIGKDADLTLVDPKPGEVITADSLHYRHRHSPYLGRKLRGRIVRTILRGQTIFQ
ncbi:MAG: allantoinase AllB, partial [Chthoniobacterales bacterium]